jgi:hypothetical protein
VKSAFSAIPTPPSAFPAAMSGPASSGTVTGILLIATSAAPVYADLGTSFADANLAAFGLLGIATAALYWLAFFPPASYRRWLAAPAV